MSIPVHHNTEYEKVPVGKLVVGTIADVEEDMEHEFTYQGEKYNAPAVRLVFDLEGCKYKKYTRWMYFSYSKKANLYKKYLVALVENAEPKMNFDIQNLKGLDIKTVWQDDNGDYQSISTIEPLESKVKYTPIVKEDNIITRESLSGKQSFDEISQKVKDISTAIKYGEDEEIPF